MRGDIYYNAVVVHVDAEKVTYDIVYDEDNEVEKGVLEKYIDVRRTVEVATTDGAAVTEGGSVDITKTDPNPKTEAIELEYTV